LSAAGTNGAFVAASDAHEIGSPGSIATPVDTTPPDTTIDSRPATPTNSSSATFAFSGTDSGSGVANYACKLDGASFTPCTSPQTYTSLSAGSHNFQVRAIDTAGNVDPTPASSTWTVLNDVSSRVNMVTSGFVYNRATKLYSGTMTITNTSGTPLSGPLAVWLQNLTGGVTLINANGSFDGYPHIDPPASTSLGAGESFSVQLKFSNPTNAKINFTPVTYD
jgi:hypothetical protein